MQIVKDIRERCDKIFEEFDYLKESVDELKEWNSIDKVLKNTVGITNFLYNVILAVEISSNELMDEIESLTINGNDKLEAAADFIDSKISLPWYLEIVDGPAIKLLLSVCVNLLNQFLGHNWNLNFAREAFSKGVDFISFIREKLNLVVGK